MIARTTATAMLVATLQTAESTPARASDPNSRALEFGVAMTTSEQ
jgi:hypothetical protein